MLKNAKKEKLICLFLLAFMLTFLILNHFKLQTIQSLQEFDYTLNLRMLYTYAWRNMEKISIGIFMPEYEQGNGKYASKKRTCSQGIPSSYL